MSAEIRNATITGTNLGVHYTDHGILSFSIGLDYGGSGQSFGGWCLDTVNQVYLDGDREAPMRIPTELGSGLLLGIDRVFGCDWEQLRGASCRAYGHNSRVIALGHFLKDKWLWLQEEPLEFVVTPYEEIRS